MLRKKIIYSGVFFGLWMTLFWLSLALLRDGPRGMLLVSLIGVMWLTGFIIFGIGHYYVDRRYRISIKLLPGENLILNDIAVCFSEHGEIVGRLFLTNKRIVFKSRTGPIDGSEHTELESMNLESIDIEPWLKLPNIFSRKLKIHLTGGLYKSFLIDFARDWMLNIKRIKQAQEHEVEAAK
jgi:hypothetical protein